MRKFVLILLTAVVSTLFGHLQAQTITLAMPDTVVAPGETIRLPISCRGFDEVVSMQFSIQWDTSVVVYQSNAKGDLNNVAIGDFQSDSGKLRLSWFAVEGVGQSLPDGTVITNLEFLARGSEGDSTNVDFTDTPLAIQIYKAGENLGEFIEIPFNPEHGKITIAEAPSISVAEVVTNVSCAGAADGQVALTILYNNEYSVSWTGPDFSSSNNSISNLGPGIYDLIIQDESGDLLYESSFDVTEPPALTINEIDTQSASCETGNGNAVVNLSGGTSPFTYDIGNGPGDSDQLNSLAPGTYTLTLTDANGCMTSSDFTIEASNIPEVDLGATRVICPGETTTLTPGSFENYLWSTGSTSSVIALSEPGIYSVTVTDAQGCEGSGEIEIQVSSNLPEVDLGPTIELCAGEVATLSSGTYSSYSWSTGATSESIQVSEAGIYQLTVTNESGCEGTGSVQVRTVGELISPDLGPDLRLCPEETVTLSGGDYATYSWSTGADSQSITVSEAGTYSLTVTNGGNCEAMATVEVTAIGTFLEVDLGADQQLCPGETTTLSAGAFASYSWSNGASSSSIVVSEAGNYALTVTDPNGCEVSDAVEVTSGESVQLLIENDFLDLCPGDSIELMISGAQRYTWIDTSNTLSALDIANPMASPDTTVAYQVIGYSACGSDTADLEVVVYEVLAMAGPDTCIGPGNTARLTAFGGVSYLWEDSRYPVSDPVSPSTTARPDDSTTYVVAITDMRGCVIRDSLTVLVANDPESSITAVNMITPNGDEKNDVLYFKNIAKFGQNSLKIFNRWGNIVYQKVNYQSDEERFDGTYNGQELPPGTYYYMLSFRTGEIKQKLTILR